jgi:Domain of unknown function (DUF4226)
VLGAALIVAVVGFLDRQAQELIAGLGVLVGGAAPQDGPTPLPSMPNGPGGLLPPAEPYQPPPPPAVSPPGGGPMPRSTLDNLHGTDDAPYPMPIVQDPDALGPSHWVEIAPGIWTPSGGRTQDHSPPWQTLPMGWSSTGADDAQGAHALLAQVSRDRGSADETFAQAILAAKQAARDSRERLQQIRDEVQSCLRSLQPSMNTPAGRQQMADFLQSRTADAGEVIRSAQDASAQAASAMAAAGRGYGSIAL